MTVLPTVRRQIEQAARDRMSSPHRPRLSAGSVAVALAAVVAVAVLVGAIVSLGARRPAAPSPGIAAADRYPLTAQGIGRVRFGARPAAVAAALTPLLGRPASTVPASSIGYARGICGEAEIVWTGLAARPAGAHSSGLTAYFRRARFVGYSYGGPYGYGPAPVVRRGRLLATAAGLGVDEPVSRGRRLYGAGFVLTSQPQGTPPNPKLDRLPSWQVQTPRGRIYGFVDSPGGPTSTRDRTIGSISAGAIPNTPCRSPRQSGPRTGRSSTARAGRARSGL